MKKLLWLLLALCLTLCACGDTNDTEPTPQKEPEAVVQTESPKGSLENPYQVGETVVIEETYVNGDHPAGGVPFRMELTVLRVYTPEESEATRYKKQFPVASVNISVTGQYEGQIGLDQLFYRPLLNGQMEKAWPMLFTSDGSKQEVSALEVGAENRFVLTVYREEDDMPMETYPYLMISHFYPDSATNRDIYIALTGESGTSPAEEAPDLAEEERAEYYQAALAAEEKGYYAMAKKFYAAIPGYQDADLHLQEMQNVLAPYNGTYYGESELHEGVGVWLYVEDGTVWAAYDVDGFPILEYELFLQSTQADGTPVMAFATELGRFFLGNHNAAYVSAFTLTTDGQKWAIKAEEGNQDRSWDCTLEKVSDTVDRRLVE